MCMYVCVEREGEICVSVCVFMCVCTYIAKHKYQAGRSYVSDPLYFMQYNVSIWNT